MNLAVIGLQWGDEGKGKAINYLAPEYEVVVRYQGGHNAGHTIYHNGEKIILHLLPSGIFSPSAISVIGNGVVVNPVKLTEEIKGVEKFGVDFNNLVLSSTAPLILPEHEQLDVVFENSRYVEIGTTRRGIGPAYEDLTGRRAVFTGDLFDKDRFYKKIKPLNEYYNKLIRTFKGEEIELESYIDEYLEYGKFLKDFTKNSIYLLNNFLKQGKKILFEGAQGVLLDINFGTFPFVTSSNPTVGGMFTGTGLSHKSLDTVTGISKAYTTRVGGGPFPSELKGDTGDYLRKQGNEYGSTTGRPRRVGWLDLVALKYAVMVNGVDDIFLTKLDVLDELEEIEMVTGYKIDGDISTIFEPDHIYLDNVTPVIKKFKGWRSDTSGIKEYKSLPEEAKGYIRFIEEFSGVPVRTVSVGVSSEQTIKNCKE